MHEVFSKPEVSSKPIEQQEYWEIRLFESDEPSVSGYLVQQSRAVWSTIDRQFMFDEIETERWPTLEKAQQRYEARRFELVSRGFSESDMDF